jgi:hypothetical protein
MRDTRPMVAIAAAFVLAGGYVHLREWLDTYRHVPSGVDGSFVVKLGFPVDAVISVVLAIALVASVVRWPRRAPIAVAAAIGFEAASLATLILTRTGSVLGWAEPIWTDGAEQTRAVEIGALLTLAVVAVLLAAARRPRSA